MEEVTTRGWFPVGKSSENGWRLDIVSLLAVIGESSMEAHSQAMTSSWTCLLPRIIPAPQALLKSTRPARLPQVPAFAIGVHNGMLVDSLNYFANIIHPVEDIPPYSFKVYRINHKGSGSTPAQPESQKGLQASVSSGADIESGVNNNAMVRRSAMKAVTNKFSGLTSKAADPNTKRKPKVPSNFWSPLNILSVLSFLLTLGLIAWAAVIKDGIAILALATISLASSIIGLASWWTAELMNRNDNAHVPPGDLVIRTRQGAFLLIICDENVSRELYTGTEECVYKVPLQPYRGLVGFGTFLLMVSVLLLGNCQFTMQAAVGVSYIVLNGAFWCAALLPKTYFWDLSGYEWVEDTPEDARNADVSQGSSPASFTRAIWYAIRETRKIGWVIKGGAMPSTPQWEEWLRQAEDNARKGNRAWDAVRAKDTIFDDAKSFSPVPGVVSVAASDPAQQNVPAIQVPAKTTR